LAFFITSAEASYQQRITLCVDIPKTYSYLPFFAGFKSTDFFDTGNTTNRISSGSDCVTHTYKKGPKNIALYIWPATFERVTINSDGSCGLYPERGAALCSKRGCIVSDYTRVEGDVTWKITLTPNKYGLTHRYDLHCERIA
jgi:hypothetical protein